MKKSEIKQWIENNLVFAEEARKLTGQNSMSSFKQSVQRGKISPFVSFGESKVFHLYEKTEMMEYGKKLRQRRGISEWMNKRKSYGICLQYDKGEKVSYRTYCKA